MLVKRSFWECLKLYKKIFGAKSENDYLILFYYTLMIIYIKIGKPIDGKLKDQ